MSEFVLNLYDESPEALAESQARVLREAVEFADSFCERNGIDPDPFLGVDNLEKLFANDMRIGKSWGILGLVDGPIRSDDIISRLDDPDKRNIPQETQEARECARANFDHNDLQKILDISVNLAILAPERSVGAPGFFQEHGILYERFVERESMFSGIVDEPFRLRLLNGRFWEGLRNCQFCVFTGFKQVNDSLINHFDDLDPGFAEKGFELLKKARGRKVDDSRLDNDFDLQNLSNQALINFGVFTQKVYERGDVFKIAEALAGPYLAEIVSYINAQNGMEPRFYSQKERFGEVFGLPFVGELITNSKKVRRCLSKSLAQQAWSDSSYYREGGHLTGVLDRLLETDRRAVGDEIVSTFDYSGDLENFSYMLTESGKTYGDYVNPEARGKIFTAIATNRAKEKKSRRRR